MPDRVPAPVTALTRKELRDFFHSVPATDDVDRPHAFDDGTRRQKGDDNADTTRTTTTTRTAGTLMGTRTRMTISEAQAVKSAAELRDYYLDDEPGERRRLPSAAPSTTRLPQGVRLPGATLFDAITHGCGRNRRRPAPWRKPSHAGPLRPRTGAATSSSATPPQRWRELPRSRTCIFRGWVSRASGAALHRSLAIDSEHVSRGGSTPQKVRQARQVPGRDGSFVSDSDGGDPAESSPPAPPRTRSRFTSKQIGKVALLNAEQEVELAKRIEAGLYAEHRLAEEGNDLPASCI